MTQDIAAPRGAVRSGRLTWAQQEWLKWQPVHKAETHEDNACLLLPGGLLPVGKAEAAFRSVLGRHEGLRTLIERDGDVRTACQHVVAPEDEPPGTMGVTDEDPRADQPGPDFTALLRTSFDKARQWPIKALFFTDGDGLVRDIAVVIDHFAIDAWGVRVLIDDVRRAVRAASDAGEPAFDQSPVEQPLDAAEKEMTERGLAEQRRTEEQWRLRLDELRAGLDGWSPLIRSNRAPSERPFHVAVLTSSRAGRDARTVASANGVPPGVVFLTAFGQAVCAVEGSPCAGIHPFAFNRLSEAARRSVRKAFMPAMPVIVPEASHMRFDKALTECARQHLRSQRFANADSILTEQLTRDVLGPHYGTGASYARFNYLDDAVLGSDADGNPNGRGLLDPYDPRSEGLITVKRPQVLGSQYYLAVRHSASCAWITLAWHESTGWGQYANEMLWRIEEQLAKTAGGG